MFPLQLFLPLLFLCQLAIKTGLAVTQVLAGWVLAALIGGAGLPCCRPLGPPHPRQEETIPSTWARGLQGWWCLSLGWLVHLWLLLAVALAILVSA